MPWRILWKVIPVFLIIAKAYQAVPADLRIFDPQKALDPFDEKFNWKALKEGPEMDNMKDMLRENKVQDKQKVKEKK